jgi:hypothetical protein
MMLSDVVAAVRQPISGRVAVRRSTALMGILFIGLGGLWLEVKSSNPASAAAANSNLGNAVNRALGGDLQPGDTITITRTGTTTTIPAHGSPSTSVGATTTAPTTLPSTSEPPSTGTSSTIGTPGSAPSSSPPTTGSTSTATTVAGHSTTTSPPGG